MSCDIFNAAGFVERVWRSADRMAALVGEALSAEGLQIEKVDFEDHPDDASMIRGAHSYRLRRVFRHQKKPAQLLVHFDFYREGPLSLWDASGEAVVLIVYDSSWDDGWEIEQLAFDSEGNFTHDDICGYLTPDPACKGRLLVFEEAERQQYDRRAWIFGVKLSTLSGPDEVERHIINPVSALLIKKEEAVLALTDVEAITWP